MPWRAAINIQGWMSPEELEWLCQQAGLVESVVEIGAWKGRATYALCAGCPGTIYSVDHFKGSESERLSSHVEAGQRNIYQDFKTNVGHFENLTLLWMDSAEAVKRFAPKSIDMVFIDGGHAYDEIMPDLKAWGPVAKKMLCGHDHAQDGVPRALNDYGLMPEKGPGSIWFVNLSKGEN